MINTNRVWKQHLSEEADFWNRWFQTQGLDWPEDYKERLSPHTILPDYYARFIKSLEKETIDILDVGAGPVTKLGKVYPGKLLRITAIDPLAREYDKILKKHKVIPPVRTIHGEAERLDKLFAPNTFDLVTAINCIDHSFDPVTAILQMVKVVRKNCVVFLSHQENEGERQNYQGLHQYGLTAIEGDLCVRNKAGQVLNISKIIGADAQVNCQLIDHWLNVVITKT